MKVINRAGTEIDFDVAVGMMDDEVREAIHAQLSPCSEQAFFTAYEAAHAAKYGEWELSKKNPIF